MSFFERLLSWFKPQLVNAGETAMIGLLEKLRLKDPKAYEVVLNALYPPIDVYLESLAKDTKNEIDDAFVAAIKGGLEKSAAANGITLPDLDNDDAEIAADGIETPPPPKNP